MDRVVRIIGSVVFALIMYSVPVLLPCAFVFRWDTLVQMVLLTIAFTQLSVLFAVVLGEAGGID